MSGPCTGRRTMRCANRELMMENMIAAVRARAKCPAFEADMEVVNCHHNYVACENHYGENVLITRKGAVRAREGELGIIPGSMGARSYIVRGKGNPESFTAAATERGERCRDAKRSGASRWTTTSRRPRAWSAARMRT